MTSRVGVGVRVGLPVAILVEGLLALALASAPAPARALPVAVALTATEALEATRSAGPLRADAVVAVEVLAAVERHLSVRLEVASSVERLQLAARLGWVLRPFAPRAHSSSDSSSASSSGASGPALFPYLHAGAGIVAAGLIDTLELRAGVGVWWRLAARVAAFAETDTAWRFSRGHELLGGLRLGLAVTTPSYW